jgi:hypothetical protein
LKRREGRVLADAQSGQMTPGVEEVSMLFILANVVRSWD